MQIDNTLARIIVDVQKAFKEKYNKDSDFNDIVDIVNTQMTATVYGFDRNISSYWKGFLKFLWTNRRHRLKERKELFNTVLDVDNNLTDKEREYYHYLARVVAHTKYKEVEKISLTSKKVTLPMLKAIPTNNIKFTNFTLLTKKRKA